MNSINSSTLMHQIKLLIEYLKWKSTYNSMNANRTIFPRENCRSIEYVVRRIYIFFHLILHKLHRFNIHFSCDRFDERNGKSDVLSCYFLSSIYWILHQSELHSRSIELLTDETKHTIAVTFWVCVLFCWFKFISRMSTHIHNDYIIVA